MEACFPCLGVRKSRGPPSPVKASPGDPRHRDVPAAARTFSLEELAAATRSFTDAYLVPGEEPCVYRGHLQSVNKVVAVRLQHLVDSNDGRVPAEQLNNEFLARVLMPNALRHPNLVRLIGFCADGSHRIWVHEYVPLGSLEDHLHDRTPDKARLDWSTRMNVAAGVARALEYLHNKGTVYRGLRSSDILLGDGDGDGYHPKLSLYGVAKIGQVLHEHVEPRDLARKIGGLALETAMVGKLSAASDVYSFGVLLLEMVTGRRVFSPQAADKDRTLVAWAQPLLEDKAEFRRMADPALQGRYPLMDLEEALAVASMCIQDDPAMRSPISAVVSALARLAYDRPS
ncbi:unnamed protein product [Alopecurus aequalis]